LFNNTLLAISTRTRAINNRTVAINASVLANDNTKPSNGSRKPSNEAIIIDNSVSILAGKETNSKIQESITTFFKTMLSTTKTFYFHLGNVT
jgi:hypothetical protein